MNITLWVLQIVLALVFLAHGIMFLVPPPDIAVLMDAMVIRTVLLPAFMKVMGRLNWWAPAPLRRLHQRWGFDESAAEQPVVTPPGTGGLPVR